MASHVISVSRSEIPDEKANQFPFVSLLAPLAPRPSIKTATTFISAIIKYITKLKVYMANVNDWCTILNKQRSPLQLQAFHFLYCKAKLSRVVCLRETLRILLSKMVTFLVARTSSLFP